MKNILSFFLPLLLAHSLAAQLNLTYKSHVEYPERLNDIWGYVGSGEREYALVGLREGVSIIDVTDTENPVIKGYASGPESTWRDIKTWGDYAYVTNEDSLGLLVINLANLPNDLTDDDFWYWNPDIPGLGTLQSCHNIYIDEFGFAYLVGCNINSGGMLYVDVFSNPGSPDFIAAGPSVYSHDVYVRDNLAYSSEINDGIFTIYDVTDKNSTLNLGDQSTPFNFTHNAWLSDDSNFIFTTDERAGAPVAAYDISDFNNIEEIDRFVPLETLGDGVTPHNVHVWNDWLVISYYTDGCIIVDASNPSNLIEVGNFDTFLPGSTGFSGAWGAYPFLPSGTVLVSDINNGCFILEPNYVRACWLEGNVKSAANGAKIQGVQIEINTNEFNQGITDFNGDYKTGLAIAGNYEVVFSHPEYFPLTANAMLENGALTILDVELEAKPTQALIGKVVETGSQNPIPNAKIFISGIAIDYFETTDADGNFSIPAVVEDDYTVYVGSWGFVNDSLNINILDEEKSFTIGLDRGYADDFILDLDWQIDGSAFKGGWERGEPIGTFSPDSLFANPAFDIKGDVGNQCYITGNGGGSYTNDDVDNGTTRIISPVMDLSNYKDPTLQFSSWFFNEGFAAIDDTLNVYVDNGTEAVIVQQIYNSQSEWRTSEIQLNDFILSTNTTRVSFQTSDQVNNNQPHAVEAGIDGFKVFDANPIVIPEPWLMIAYPNPFDDTFSIKYELESLTDNSSIYIYNVLGQLIDRILLDNITGTVLINSIQSSGVYFLHLEGDGQNTQVIKMIKN